jgi:enamine deaminase RidA (YjgF/YER057c/UK114 family)
MERRRVSDGVEWEPLVGYSRAVRAGELICVSGTTASPADGALAGDMYAQTVEVLRRIESALERAGATMADVVRTRMYVTDISRWEDVARAHREQFGHVRPATTMVEVSRLIDPSLLIEIEADAVVNGGAG